MDHSVDTFNVIWYWTRSFSVSYKKSAKRVENKRNGIYQITGNHKVRKVKFIIVSINMDNIPMSHMILGKILVDLKV